MSVISVIPDSSVWCTVKNFKGRIHSLYPLRLLLDPEMSEDRMCFGQSGTGNTSTLGCCVRIYTSRHTTERKLLLEPALVLYICPLHVIFNVAFTASFFRPNAVIYESFHLHPTLGP